MAPWVNLFVQADSTIRPCCHITVNNNFEKANDSSLKLAWNNDTFKYLRKTMLEGRKIDICINCYLYEESGCSSLRNIMNENYANYFHVVESTQNDGYLDSFVIKYIDIRYSNLCNYKCRTCDHNSSSSWYSDEVKLYNHNSIKPKIISCTSGNTNKLWDDLIPIIIDTDVLSFAGGEPLIMDEHYTTLNLLIDNNSTNKRISYISNLGTLKFKNYNIIDLWNKFPQIDLNVSIDDFGKRGEYLRHGTKWKNIVTNIQVLKQNVKSLKLSVYTTISVYNVYYFPELFIHLVTNNLAHKNMIRPILLINPQKINIQIFPHKFKEIIKKKLLTSIKKVKRAINDHDTSIYEEIISTIIKFMFAQDQSYLIPEFQEYTKKLDKIRGEDFNKTYPELSSLLNPIEGLSKFESISRKSKILIIKLLKILNHQLRIPM